MRSKGACFLVLHILFLITVQEKAFKKFLFFVLKKIKLLFN